MVEIHRSSALRQRKPTGARAESPIRLPALLSLTASRRMARVLPSVLIGKTILIWEVKAMRSVHKIRVICLLTVILTVLAGPVTGYPWTYDDDYGRNYDYGNRVDYYNGDRPYPPYGAGYGPPPPPPAPPYPSYGPPPPYYGPPVSVVIPFPAFGFGYWGGPYHHHRHWR